ncbi:MAG TPA: hypothetical protein VGM08_02565 [Candidatus Saccharimonadales bacterium]|jgi:hypothetical protein
MSTANTAALTAAEAQLNNFLANPTHALLLSGTDREHKASDAAAQLLGVNTLENQPHYRQIVPEKGSIAIEQIRDLIGFFRLKVPGTAKIKRVAVLQDANTMGIEAQNALLKLLEEPPAGSVLILTSAQPQGLLATIRSRVQILRLPGANQTPEAGMVQLVKQALSGTTYDRLLLVDGLAKQKEAAVTFVTALATIAMASLEAAARKQSASVNRWKTVLQAAHTAEGALMRSGNTKLVLTELMLAI